MPDDGQRSPQLHRHSVSKLGEYKVIKDIAEGTFGKVKSAFFPSLLSCLLSASDILLIVDTSGKTCYHRPDCRNEVSFKGSYPQLRYQVPRPQGSSIHAHVETSTHS